MKILNNIYQIDAFTTEPFNGNPAAVVISDDLTDEDMQQIAKEINLSETAFLSASSSTDYKLRWFTPVSEVELCGHATIASIHYLAERNLIGKNDEVTFETRSGILKCKRADDLYFMQLPVPEFTEYNGSKDEILKALDLDKKQMDLSFPFLIQKGGYLYIYVPELNSIKNMNPSFDELVKLSEANLGFTVFTVFTKDTIDGNDVFLRFFAPAYGIDEDPVTVTSNGPLLLVLRELGLVDKDTEGKQFTFEQGDFLGRKGRVKVSYSPAKNELTIAGNAVTVLKGELSF